jgi:hypothetical protein
MKTTKLKKLRACIEAIEYVKTRKSAVDAWMNCDRGDWMLWLAKRLDVDDRKLTLAKAMCVKQVEHLMKDQRSLDALEGCFKYAKGELTREELDELASASASAYAASAAYAYAAYAYAYASASAAYAASAYAYASDASASAASAAKKESLKKSADICREVLTEEVLQKYKNTIKNKR